MIMTKKFFLLILLQALYPGSYCDTWNFSFPSNIQALENSCVEIPCSFSHPKDVKQHIVKWYPIGKNFIYELLDTRSSISEDRGQAPLLDTITHSCALRLDIVGSKDEGRYFPGISNSINAYDLNGKTIQLDVSGVPPQILLEVPTEIIEGRPVNITCSADHTCAFKPPSLHWNIEGHPVIEFHIDQGEGKLRAVSQLTFHPSSKDQGSTIGCRATYPNGKRYRKEGKLNIEYPPKETKVVMIKTKPNEGDDVYLYCNSKSSPEETLYEWFVGKERIKMAHQTWSIVVRNVSWDSEPYSCSAVNKLGRGESAVTEILVQYAAKKVQIIRSDTKNGNVFLKCYFLSSRPNVTHYTWYLNNTELKDQKQQTIILKKNETNPGIYHCAVHNIVGTTSSPSLKVIFMDKEQKTETSIFNFPVILGSLAACIMFILAILVLCIFMRRKTRSVSSISPVHEINPTRKSDQAMQNKEGIPMEEKLYVNLHDEKSKQNSMRYLYNELKEEEAFYSNGQHGNPEEVQYSSIQHTQSDQPKRSTLMLKHSEATEYAVVVHN
ncbi:B-cell receptor CD22-like isoform 1-T1 [Discoglossus pictus]